jgi:hypothetical protein
MKRLLTLFVILFASMQMFAQVQFNPQIGLNYMTFGNLEEGMTAEGKTGFSIGADLRFGQRLQFQPGVHYITSSTAVEDFIGVDFESGEVTQDYLKLKALFGYNIVDNADFKFRINFGPAYDFLLSAELKETGEDLKNDFENGTFFLQGGLGVDFWILTADLGYAQGLSQTFAGETAPNAKTSGVYFTVGVIFGKGKK